MALQTGPHRRWRPGAKLPFNDQFSSSYGQPFGIGLMENVIKECEEEAGIPLSLAKKARPAGCISYATIEENGVKQDVLFVYDLLLPEDFLPQPNDGEVFNLETPA